MLHYANELEQEAPGEIAHTKPPVEWPQHGAVSFNKVVMSYRVGLPTVLKGMSLDVRPGEKVGIIGRYGSLARSFTLPANILAERVLANLRS